MTVKDYVDSKRNDWVEVWTHDVERRPFCIWSEIPTVLDSELAKLYPPPNIAQMTVATYYQAERHITHLWVDY